MEIDDLSELYFDIFMKIKSFTQKNFENNLKIIRSIGKIGKELIELITKKSYDENDDDVVKKLREELEELDTKIDNIFSSPQTKEIVYVHKIKLENKFVPLHPKVNEALENIKTCVMYIDSLNTWYCYNNDFQFAIKPQPMDQNVPTFYEGRIEYPQIFEYSTFEELCVLKWSDSTAIKIGDFTFEILVSNKDKYFEMRKIFYHQLNECKFLQKKIEK